MSPRILSTALLSVGGLCITTGAFLILGLGAALVVFGILLIAADLLVPGR